MTQARVVVGIDGSPTSTTALVWALETAGRHGADVEAVHAWRWDVTAYAAVSPDTPVELVDLARRTADACVERALADRRADAPQVQVHARTVEGDASSALVSAAASAELLVIGRHGRSAVAEGLLGPSLGHVAGHCLSRSPAPVAVVPGGTPAAPPRRVVVGVDGSAASARALAWAVEHAQGAVPVVAVLAWQLTTLPAPESSDHAVPPLPEWQASAERLLRETVEAALPADAAAAVEQVVLHEPATAGVLSAVGEGDLLVLGDRGRGGFARLVLGSVSRQCAEHAPCPVVVVPPRDRPAGPAEA